MTVIGKTIARVEDPEGVLHFTDGTAVLVHGWEDGGASFDGLTAEDVRRRAARLQGRREQRRIERLRQQEWRAAGCDERARRNAKRGPSLLLPAYLLRDMAVSMGLRTFRRCTTCGDANCENAETTTTMIEW